MTRSAVAARRRLRGAGRRSASLGALALRPAGAGRARRAVRAAARARARGSTRTPGVGVSLHARARAGARGRRGRGRDRAQRRRRRSSGSSSCSSLPRRARDRRRASSPSLSGSAADDERTLELTLRCDRWGNYELGDIRAARPRPARAARLGGSSSTGRTRCASTRCPETLQQLVPPARDAAVCTGNQVARQKGDGLEFADLRPFAPGDRVRSINWRASARRRDGELVVNERHPERNADVILFLDSFAEARAGERSTLDLAVRAAATLASRYLERRDRVGLVSFGGILRWLCRGWGSRSATGSSTRCSSPRSSSTTPGRTSRSSRRGRCRRRRSCSRSRRCSTTARWRRSLDLRARGYDLAVVEVSPVPFVEPGRERARPARLPALAAAARGAARALRARSASPSRRWRRGRRRSTRRSRG